MREFQHLSKVAAVAFVAACLCVSTSVTAACPFCAAPSLTLTEQLAKADAAVQVQWVGGDKGDGKEKFGNTVYEVVDVLRDVDKKLKKGDRITLERYRAGKKGDLSLLLGSKLETLEWGSPLEVTETSYNYIVQAPSPESTPEKRLAYFLKFLEFPDPLVSNDAYAEFANAPYKDIVLLAKQMPRDKIRKWLADPNVSATRLGLYGLMLGLCGEPSDANLMEDRIKLQSEEFRLGIDGVMGGYLLLTGDDGLKVIEETKFQNKKVPFSETYATMQALRFMWTYGDGRISKERLQASMRMLLDRPELADLVISDLARWKDWSVTPKLMSMYGDGEFNVPSIKRAIVRYMLACTKDVPKVAAAEGQGSSVSQPADVPAHVNEAKRCLEQLRNRDVKTVTEAERFFFLP
jgi:hypothetical protein